MRGRDAALAGSEHDAGPEYRPSDVDLGIGEPDETVTPAGGQLADLLRRPDIAAAVETLVAERVRQQVGAAPQPAASMADLVALLVTALDRHAAVHGEQQPGHLRPLPAEEVEARGNARQEMGRLMAQAIAEQSRPIYLLHEDFYAVDTLWARGDQIVWYGVPNTEMEPQNGPATDIFAALLRSIGGMPEYGSNHAEDRPATPSVMEVYRNPNYLRLTERIETPRRDIGPRRITGTVVPEGPASVNGGPVRHPTAVPVPIVGTVMPNEQPSPLQAF